MIALGQRRDRASAGLILDDGWHGEFAELLGTVERAEFEATPSGLAPAREIAALDGRTIGPA